MAAHLKNEFTKVEKCHNFMTWLIFGIQILQLMNTKSEEMILTVTLDIDLCPGRHDTIFHKYIFMRALFLGKCLEIWKL